MMMAAAVALALAAGAAPAPAAPAADPMVVSGDKPLATLTPQQAFAASDAMLDIGDIAGAEALLEALTGNKSLPLRSEARYRLGQLCAARGDWRCAADWYRAVLAEEPEAAPVRLELAAAYARLGDMDAARRELRRAQAAQLPVAVARQVDRISDALRNDAPYGGDFSLGIAPNTNVNRATSARTINIGDIVLEIDRDGRAVSGIGLAGGARGFARTPISDTSNLLVEAAISGVIYPSGRFNDIGGTLSVGPEFRRPGALVRPSLVVGRRLFDGRLLYDYGGAAVTWRRDVGRTAQLATSATVSYLDYPYRPALSGLSLGASASYEKSLSQLLFVSLTLTGARLAAQDPAYSTWVAGVQTLASRDFGRIVAFGGINYSHLESDVALALFQRRRSEDFVEVYAGITAARLAFRGFAPSAKLTYANNASTIAVYAFSATRFDLALSRSF